MMSSLDARSWRPNRPPSREVKRASLEKGASLVVILLAQRAVVDQEGQG
jgi:hypothetical protein